MLRAWWAVLSTVRGAREKDVAELVLVPVGVCIHLGMQVVTGCGFLDDRYPPGGPRGGLWGE